MTEKTQSFWEKNAALIKIAVIGFLAIVLLIPTAMIIALVEERQQRLNEATNEISSKWGYAQRVTGPILTIPYYTFDFDKSNKVINKSKHFAHYLPEDLNIDGTISPEVRYRGIFQVAVYETTLSFKGSFKKPTFDTDRKDIEVLWDEAFVTFGISDLRGIKESIVFGWNGTEFQCEPGVKVSNVVESGITVNHIIKDSPDDNDLSFNFNVVLNGSQSLNFVPVGKETNVSIASSWGNPSFDGAFLPVTREITSDGFKASWRVLELNRNYPQHWVDREVNLSESAFGVSLLLPVDKYRITERSIKYAILFISLTFMVFFFVEVLRKMRVHPIQYILVGFGLVLFYLLLLSLSEHISFGYAYTIASAGIVIMISAYSRSIFKDNKLTLMVASLMILLYAFLYILLQLQDYALLIGSVGLFIILSTVMYLSRKIDWYEIAGSDKI